MHVYYFAGLNALGDIKVGLEFMFKLSLYESDSNIVPF